MASAKKSAKVKKAPPTPEEEAAAKRAARAAKKAANWRAEQAAKHANIGTPRDPKRADKLGAKYASNRKAHSEKRARNHAGSV